MFVLKPTDVNKNLEVKIMLTECETSHRCRLNPNRLTGSTKIEIVMML